MIPFILTLLSQNPLTSTTGSLSRTEPLVLKDEGTRLGSVSEINCSGAGITCTKSGVTGTISVSGSGTCTLASPGVNGCVNSTTGDSQSIDGYHTWLQLGMFNDTYSLGSGLQAGVWSPAGVGTSSVAPTTNNSGLNLSGRRGWGDPDPGTIVKSTNWRDAGYMFAVAYPNQCSTAYAFAVGENGEIHYGNTVETNTCTSNVASGNLLHRNGNAGAHALDREDGYYLTIAGGLGALEGPASCAIEPNGIDRPYDDGGTWVRTNWDGGTCYNFAGEHGDINLASKYPMRAGYIAEIFNPINGNRTDHRAFWDYNGGYAQNHQLNLAQFGAQQTIIPTNLGDYYYGALKSTQMYAFDTKHWYFANGTTWVQFLDSSAVVTIPQGGTGSAPSGDDQLLVSDSSSAATWRTVPDCADTGGNHLNYTASSNSFSCGTSGGGGSPLTTKGDLYTFSTVNDRLPVGADGLCLKALSSASTGLEWNTCAAGGSGITYAEAAAAVMGGF